MDLADQVASGTDFSAVRAADHGSEIGRSCDAMETCAQPDLQGSLSTTRLSGAMA
jgi:hypothetical protein